MINNIRHITVFEHQKLIFNLTNQEEKNLHDSLEKFYRNYSPFFSLIRNGVQFNEHVGIIQVGKTLIEILPKADQKSETEWRNLLIRMIQTIWNFQVKESGNSQLKISKNSVLDLYFALFIKEIEIILHKGLIKKYRKTEGNCLALKGSLQFSKHISENVTHQERFYVKYSTYDVYHQIHSILYLALKLVSQLNTDQTLKSKISTLFLNFPEMENIKISEKTFENITFDRKNIHYKKAFEIAKLLLLNYHPDLSKGKNNVLALMFDMNLLWEQFVYITLKKKLLGYQISSQQSKNFWKPQSGNNSKMRPDIILKKINTDEEEIIILDTKWKNLNGYNPSSEDLRQMYVYHSFFRANRTGLIYPGEKFQITKGNYYSTQNDAIFSDKECNVLTIQTDKNIKTWQSNIINFIENSILKLNNFPIK